MAAANLDELRTQVDEAVDWCLQEIRTWKWLYFGGRSALILFAGLTSAQALNFGFLAQVQPVFALLVTLITGFDVWLKPGAKYRALYVANDEYVRIRLKASQIDPTDPVDPTDPGAWKAVAKLLEEFDAINLRLQNALMP